MKTSNLRLTILALGFSWLVGACAAVAPRMPPPDETAIFTQAAQTLEARLAQTLAAPSATPSPTETQDLATPTLGVPTNTPIPTATGEPGRCDWAGYVADVTVPDGAAFTPGAFFIKTWRLKNIGTCTWTPEYDLVFFAGDHMGASPAVSLPTYVLPGETVDVSVEMEAPFGADIYTGYWRLRNANNVLFGIGQQADDSLWVRIRVSKILSVYPYNFALSYCLADWHSDSGELRCPGREDDSDGSTILLERPVLENRHEDEPALWTRPNVAGDGWINGEYPPVRIKDHYHFRAWIGCLADSQGCDVIFRLNYRIGDGPVENLGEWHEVYDGQITNVDVDLSSLVGEEVQFILRVEVDNDKPQEADAFWFLPSLREIKPPPTPLPPTATPTATSTPDYQDNPAVQAARAALAQGLGVDVGAVAVVSVETAEWSDTCLELPDQGETCDPATILGFEAVMAADGGTYEVHTNEDGSQVRWVQTG